MTQPHQQGDLQQPHQIHGLDTFLPEPTVPTVEEVLASVNTWGKMYCWPAKIGGHLCTRDELKAALEAAYDPMMADWPTMVQMD